MPRGNEDVFVPFTPDGVSEQLTKKYTRMSDGSYAETLALGVADPAISGTSMGRMEVYQSGTDHLLVSGKDEHGTIRTILTEEVGSPVVITFEHFYVHEGNMFQFEHYVASVADSNSVDLLVTTGTEEPHFLFDVSAGGKCTVYLYEEPTAFSGTVVPIYNMFRRSEHTPLLGVTHTPTGVTPGSVILVNRVLPGGTSVQTRVGGGIRQNTEWVLKPSAKYLLRVTNASGGAISVSIVGQFYEHYIT